MEIKLATVRRMYMKNSRFRTARAINSDDFTTDQVRIFKKRNKEFEQILIPMDSAFKVGYAMVLVCLCIKAIAIR
jgi:hypothetical protein